MSTLPFEQSEGPLRRSPELRELQAQGPVHAVTTAVGDPAWLVTGYEEVRRLLADDRFGRAHPEPERASRSGESALFGGPLGDFDTEQSDHRRMRALLQPHFSPKRMRALRSRIEALTTSLLDDMEAAGSPADLHTALALPLPIAVICELLGVPYADRDLFRAWSQAAADVTDRARSEKGLADLFLYGRDLVARKRAEGDPDADVISRLAATEGVCDDEAAMLGMSLLFAGHETTVTAIGMGTLWMMSTPGQWQALAADPARVDATVEEILRGFGLGGGGLVRYARTDLDLEGVQVRTGDLVLLDTGAANHDPAAYIEPERFDPGSPVAPHLSFGHGARYCIGAPLARIELSVVFGRLVTRFPAMRLGRPLEEMTFDPNTLTGGLTSLPVTW
ncbi:cytochrome P450 [Herbidospora mongoliensis]|uniref:cytochrome P450 n=1 Tax=Herbidospora mongoliensis TaxID=688067 RepID=UPI0008318EBC|nr:cytochrome P450 [Herbidospora mongoliensis]